MMHREGSVLIGRPTGNWRRQAVAVAAVYRTVPANVAAVLPVSYLRHLRKATDELPVRLQQQCGWQLWRLAADSLGSCADVLGCPGDQK